MDATSVQINTCNLGDEAKDRRIFELEKLVEELETKLSYANAKNEELKNCIRTFNSVS